MAVGSAAALVSLGLSCRGEVAYSRCSALVGITESSWDSSPVLGPEARHLASHTSCCTPGSSRDTPAEASLYVSKDQALKSHLHQEAHLPHEFTKAP